MSWLFLRAHFYVAQKTAELLLWMVVQAIPCICFAGEKASEEAFPRLCCSLVLALPPVPAAAHARLCSSRTAEGWAETRMRKTCHSLLDPRLGYAQP